MTAGFYYDALKPDPEDVEYARQMDEALASQCGDCGEPVPIGGWPFCASERNPDGHAKGAAYTFKMRMGMRLNGWTRRER